MPPLSTFEHLYLWKQTKQNLLWKGQLIKMWSANIGLCSRAEYCRVGEYRVGYWGVCVYYPGPAGKYCGGFATIVNSPGSLTTLLWVQLKGRNHNDTELNMVLDDRDLKPCRVEVCERERWTMGTNWAPARFSLAALPIIALGQRAMYGWVDGGPGVVDCF